MINLRPLREELVRPSGASIQGWHDFTSPAINALSATRDLVIGHENIHDEILFKTPYGGLQFVSNELAHKIAKSDNRLHPSAREVFFRLSDASDIAHESAATYLSITLQPAERHRELLHEHPLEYQQYYKNLEEPTGMLSRSSYVQYLIGRAIVDIIFAPPLRDMVHAWFQGHEFNLPRLCRPNTRLELFSEIIRRQSVEVLEECKVRSGAVLSQVSINDLEPLWESENWWEMTSFRIRTKVEEILANEIFQVLRNRSEASFPTSDPAKWRPEQEYVIELARRVAPTVNGAVSHLHSKGWPIRPTAIRVVNPDAPSLKELRQATRLSTIENVFANFDKESAFLFEKKHDDELGGDWVKCTINRNPRAILAERCPRPLLVKALRSMHVIGLLGAPTPLLPPFIFACDSSTESFESAYNFLVPLVTEPLTDGIMDFGTKRLFWYLQGEFVDWLQALEGAGRVEIAFTTSAEIQVKMRERIGNVSDEAVLKLSLSDDVDSIPGFQESVKLAQDPSTEKYKSPSMIFMKTEKLFGYFVKIVPYSLAGRYLNIAREFANVALIPFGTDTSCFPHEDKRRLLDLVPTILAAVLSVWGEL
jgi:hypothetical protein